MLYTYCVLVERSSLSQRVPYRRFHCSTTDKSFPPYCSAQAFQDIFSDFDSWLRETERKIQRDDPLKLEMKELKKGLAYLQGISGDIAVHEAAFEKVRAECCDLIGRGAGDPEELQRNLDTLQQRWNAVQVRERLHSKRFSKLSCLFTKSF